MTHQDIALDNLIRSSLRAEAGEQEPSTSVREGLLARAANNRLSQLPVQESIPSLVKSLGDAEEQPEVVHWWETECSQRESFALWGNAWQRPGLVHVLLYHEARRSCLNDGAY